MKKVDLSKVKEAGNGSYKRLPVGGYVLRILKVVDVPEYNRLDFYYDIAEGEYKDYYLSLIHTPSPRDGLLYRMPSSA